MRLAPLFVAPEALQFWTRKLQLPNLWKIKIISPPDLHRKSLRPFIVGYPISYLITNSLLDFQSWNCLFCVYHHLPYVHYSFSKGMGWHCSRPHLQHKNLSQTTSMHPKWPKLATGLILKFLSSWIMVWAHQPAEKFGKNYSIRLKTSKISEKVAIFPQ